MTSSFRRVLRFNIFRITREDNIDFERSIGFYRRLYTTSRLIEKINDYLHRWHLPLLMAVRDIRVLRAELKNQTIINFKHCICSKTQQKHYCFHNSVQYLQLFKQQIPLTHLTTIFFFRSAVRHSIVQSNCLCRRPSSVFKAKQRDLLDSPTHHHTFSIYTDINVNIRFIALKVRLQYN